MRNAAIRIATAISIGTAALMGAAGIAAAAPLIGDALSCGQTGTAGSLAPGTQMQRVDVDLAAFPDALCNDGSGAVLYYRPHSDPAHANRWVIQVQGGGGCSSGDSCANRWCKIGTNFSMLQMSSAPAPPGIDGKGILDRRPSNPLGTWNHVFVRYCSSDSWTGNQADVELTGTISSAPVDYRIHFLGRRVLDAAIDTLRRDGVTALVYTQTGATLPDLDDAEVVLIAGASAGARGVIQNVDRIAAHLEANSSCGGGSCPLEVRALIDSSFGPDLEPLDFSFGDACVYDGICDWQAVIELSNEAYDPQPDASCDAWHQANDPGTEWQCEDRGHVVRHHVTTPMFIRMGQRDELISQGYFAGKYAIAGQQPMKIDDFQGLVRNELAALASIQSTAHEGASIAVVPGVFGPTCSNHETLRNNPQIFRTSIEVGGQLELMFHFMANWLAAASPSVAITQPGSAELCAGADSLPSAGPATLALLVAALLAAGAVAALRTRRSERG